MADEDRGRPALRLIAVSFFVLAAYVSFESVRDLVSRAEPQESVTGIVLALLSLIVMPALAVAKRRTGHALGDPVIVADAAETMLCHLLSLILLSGLLLNAVADRWWADPMAALGIAYLALRERPPCRCVPDDRYRWSRTSRTTSCGTTYMRPPFSIAP